MASWVLIEAGKSLFAAFNAIAPSRDKASDGTIGDGPHSKTSSDHNPDETGTVPIHDADKVNEVHAIDVDNNLNESDLTMEKVVQFLLGRCRSGAEKRLRYIIWDRRIWSASSGWTVGRYDGSSPHTEHAHFSFSYVSSLEASTASWHLEDIPVALTAADKTWISNTINTAVGKVITEVNQVPAEVWGTQFQRPGEEIGKKTTAGAYQSYNDVVNRDTANAAAGQVIATLEPRLVSILNLLANQQPAKP